MGRKRPASSQKKNNGGKKRKTDKDRTPLNDPRSKGYAHPSKGVTASAVAEKRTEPSLPDKIFNDPIHGHIEINPLCVKIIDTPQFQRLRSIKQLGGTYFVYPGASHNRFEHSIGVCHLAGQLVSALRVGKSELNITDDDVMCVQIAGLCHDLGHGPFSHMFDGRFLPSIGNRTKGWPYEGRGQEKRFLYEIVANKRNGIDVDKWDYFARDCHMLGIKNSFDHARCLKLARVVEVDGEKQICFRDKEVENLYDMFHTRIKLYRQAYEHCVGNTIEIMISEAMKKADKHIRTPGKNNKTFSISGTLDDMEAYEKLTDSIVDRIMCSQAKSLEESKKILMNVKNRKLYVCLGHALSGEKMTDEAVMKRYVEILKKNGSMLRENDVTIDVVKLNYGMKDKNPIDHVRFYKKDSPDNATKIDKNEVSFLLPKMFAENQIRFYCKRNDEKSLSEANDALKDWCQEKKCSLINGSHRIAMTAVKSTDKRTASGDS